MQAQDDVICTSSSLLALTFRCVIESSIIIMTKTLSLFLLILTGTFILTSPVAAQTDNVRVAVANLNQDVALLVQQVKALRLEVEEMQRQNARLRAQVAASASDNSTDNKINNLSSAIETLRREYRQADEVQKNQIIAEVTRQIEALAKQTQGAINSVANAVESEPQIAVPVHFSDDYPKSGIKYTVRSGDTLSQIARAHGSSIKHIQNANKIANPAKDLQVGQTIFIPISE